MKTIAVDFDDVLMEFNAGFLASHNRLYNTSLVFENLIDYDNWERIYGCDKESMAKRARDFYQSPEHMLVSPVIGAVEAIQRLSENHYLHIVTSRPETVRHHTLEWLDRHFPNLFHDFHFTNIYAGEHGVKPKAKAEVCKEIGAEVLIDDALKHATLVAASGIPVLLPDRPWNRDLTPAGVTRVKTWGDIVLWVEENIKTS